MLLCIYEIKSAMTTPHVLSFGTLEINQTYTFVFYESDERRREIALSSIIHLETDDSTLEFVTE